MLPVVQLPWGHLLDVNGNLTNIKTLDFNANNLDLEGVLTNSGTLVAQGDETISILTPQSIDGKMIYDGAVTSNLTSDITGYYDLTFNNAGGSWTMPIAIDIDGTFHLVNGVYTQTTGTMSVADDFTLNNGTTFTRTGTLVFDGSGDVVFTDNRSPQTTMNTVDYRRIVIGDN